MTDGEETDEQFNVSERVDELFLAAIDLPASERSAFVEQEAKNDPLQVRERLYELLSAEEEVGTEFAGVGPLNLQDLSADSLPDPRLGETIGEFVLQDRIASGGFGTVYRATRAEPYKEEVAIKLLHRENLASPPVVQRVLREMQALSDLRHPYIVSQLQSGVSEHGEPYIVMEYVHGKTLVEHCDEGQLSIQERLELFQKICEAVQFAHQNDWVHRDLKPGNILVADDGTPKLLDFGIAKLGGDNPLDQQHTMTHGIIGTPPYMSPEQFAGSRVGPAADIYALGAILYELLSGHRAFDVMCAGIDDVILEAIQVAVRETVPRRPSNVVVDDATKTGVTKEDVALCRQSSPSNLRRSLKGDVDNIAMMALRKEPERRYQSVGAISEDIQRWLEHRPVIARADSIGYRTSKFVRRNRKEIAVCLAFAGCLLAGFAALQFGRNASQGRDLEESRRLVESAQTFLDDDNVPRALVELYAAFEASKENSTQRESIRRMLGGWSRYLGVPLASEPGVRCAFQERGDRVVVTSGSGDVEIWNALTLQRERLEVSIHRPVEVMAVQLEDSDLRLIRKADGQVSLDVFELDQRETWQTVASRAAPPDMGGVSFAGDQLVVGRKTGDSKQVEIWDASNLETQKTFDDISRVGSLAVDQRLLAQSMETDGEFRTVLWDCDQDRAVGSLVGRVMDVDQMSDRVLIRAERKLSVHDLGTGTIRTLEGTELLTVRPDACFSEVDDAVVTSELRVRPIRHVSLTSYSMPDLSSTSPRRFFCPSPGAETRKLETDELRSGHDSESIQFSPSGRYVVLDARPGMPVSRSTLPWLWNTRPFFIGGGKLNPGEGERTFSFDGKFVMAIADGQLTGIDTGEQSTFDRNLPATCLDVSAAVSRVALGQADGVVQVMSLPDLTAKDSYRFSDPIRRVAFDRTGSKLLIETPYSLRVVDLATRKVTVVSDSDKSAIVLARFSGESNITLVTGQDAVLYVDGPNRIRRLSVANLSGEIIDGIVEDDRAVFLTLYEGAVMVSDGMNIPHQLGAKLDCTSAAVSADGLVVAVGHENGDVQFWDAVLRKPLTRRIHGLDAPIEFLEFSANAKQAIAMTPAGDYQVLSAAFRLPVSDEQMETWLEIRTGFDLAEGRKLHRDEWLKTYDSTEPNR